MLFWIARIIAELITALSLFVAQETPMGQPTIVATQEVQQADNLDTWIAQSNWPQWAWLTVRRIVMCESGGIPGINTNPPHVGLMQANVEFWGYPSGGPVGELNQGFFIYQQQGWGAWQCK